MASSTFRKENAREKLTMMIRCHLRPVDDAISVFSKINQKGPKLFEQKHFA